MNKEELLLNLENSAPEFMYSDTITADKKSKERTIRKCADPKKKTKRKMIQASQKKKQEVGNETDGNSKRNVRLVV